MQSRQDNWRGPFVLSINRAGRTRIRLKAHGAPNGRSTRLEVDFLKGDGDE